LDSSLRESANLQQGIHGGKSAPGRQGLRALHALRGRPLSRRTHDLQGEKMKKPKSKLKLKKFIHVQAQKHPGEKFKVYNIASTKMELKKIMAEAKREGFNQVRCKETSTWL
jgi:hypothetical protein